MADLFDVDTCNGKDAGVLVQDFNDRIIMAKNLVRAITIL